MAEFLIYLFESGLCLSLFYLGYVVFFRKETYFTFNRFYLLGSLILALLIPLISIHIELGDEGYINETARGVRQFKDYYERLILLTDPDLAFTGHTTSLASQSGEMVHDKIKSAGLSLSDILLIIYTLGVLFFSFRLVYLLRGLIQMTTKAIKKKDRGITVVHINEEVPSFSFLKWIFVNPQILKPNEYEQVLTHEKVHVQHKHSVDLLLAHIITIFQWFNPLTWRIQKSIKTCHEYIADRQVVLHGHELFDYQSLLLSQLISIRSVELVNNFNLLSIKKRIAMMNKNKSGRWAQLKAIAVIPILIAAFFIFTDMTSRNDNLVSIDITTNNKNDSRPLSGDQLEKSNLPYATQAKPYKKEMILCDISLSNGKLFVNQKACEFNKLQSQLTQLRADADQSMANMMTVLLNIDIDEQMKDVDQIKTALRNSNNLKMGYLSHSQSPKKTGNMALFQLLPPPEAKWLEKDELEAEGIALFEIGKSYTDFSNNLVNHIRTNKKYVMLYEYDNETTYNDYIRTVDLVYKTINKLRKKAALADDKNFDELTYDQQKEYRKRYPITLTMKNSDAK